MKNLADQSGNNPVSSLMTSKFLCVPSLLPVSEAIRCMSDAGAHFLVVLDGDRPVGLLDERSALRFMVLQSCSADQCEQEIPWESFIITHLQTSLETASALLARSEASYLLLVNDYGSVEGVVRSSLIPSTPWPGVACAEDHVLREGMVMLEAHSRKVSDVTCSFAEMLGYTCDELLGKCPWDWDAKFSKTEIETMTFEHRASGHGAVRFFETAMRRKDGSLCDMEVNAVLIDFAGSQQILCICRDITERKLTEQTLREREELFSAIVNRAPVGVVVVDAETLRFVEFNDIACETLGFSREEFALLSELDINAEMSSDEHARFKREIVQSGHGIFDTLHRHKDGSLRNVRVCHCTIEIQGRNGFIAIWTDITDQLKLEEQLVHARKMEAVGQLAGGVAHDFNNILTAIVGFAHLIEMKLENDADLKKYIRLILESAERASGLTGDLLTFSRKRVLVLCPLDLNDIVLKTEKLLARLIRADIKLLISCCDSTLTVMADEAQFGQILMNLTTNARDAMPDGGVITITTASIELDQEQVNQHGSGKPGRFALMTFEDTGCGMTEETRKKVFEPFFTTKGQGKGTGLGLATVYGVVSQLGGFITVYSEPNRGTTFRIYFPELQVAAVAEDRGEDVSSIPGGSEIILLGEDDPTVREMVSLLLMEAGYGVFVAENGVEALEVFRDKKDLIDLMILDVIMPDKNGTEVLKHSLELKADVDAILMSGYTSEIAVMSDFIQKGVKFIQKPVNPGHFLTIVREVLDKRAIMRSHAYKE